MDQVDQTQKCSNSSSGGGGLDKTPGGGTGCRRRRWQRAWQWTASIWAMGLVGVLRKNSIYCGLFSTV
jgi:hypothetical protein